MIIDVVNARNLDYGVSLIAASASPTNRLIVEGEEIRGIDLAAWKVSPIV